MFTDSEIIENLLDKSPFGIAIRDSEGGYYKINTKFTEITGYNFHDLVNLTFKRLSSKEMDSLENFLLHKIIPNNEESWNGEFRYIHKNGKIINVRQWIESYEDPESKLTQFYYLYLEDITNVKAIQSMEMEILRSNSIAEFFQSRSIEIEDYAKTILNQLKDVKSYILDSGNRLSLNKLQNGFNEIEAKTRSLSSYCHSITNEIKSETNIRLNRSSSLKDLFHKVYNSIRGLQKDENWTLGIDDCREDELVSLEYSTLFQLLWNLYMIALQKMSNHSQPHIIFKRESIENLNTSGMTWRGNNSGNGTLIRIAMNTIIPDSIDYWNRQFIHIEDSLFKDQITIILAIAYDNNLGIGYNIGLDNQSEFLIFIPKSIHDSIDKEHIQTLRRNMVHDFLNRVKLEKEESNPNSFLNASFDSGSKPLDMLFIIQSFQNAESYRDLLKEKGFTIFEEIATNKDEIYNALESKSFQAVIYRQPESEEIDWDTIRLIRSYDEYIPILIHANTFKDIASFPKTYELFFSYFTHENINTIGLLLERDLRYSRILQKQSVQDLDLSETKNFYNRIFNSISDILVIYDLETYQVEYLNETVKDILGYTVDQMNDLELRNNLVHPEDADNILFFFFNLRMAEINKTYRINYRMRDIKGNYRYLENVAQVLELNSQGKVKKVINSISDRSDHYKYLDLMNQSVTKIRNANESKTRFLANISHELKTPLNSILGYSEFLQMPGMTPLSEQQKLYIETIHKSGKYLLDLMNIILDYSKSEMNKMTLNKVKTDIHGLVSSVIDSYLIIAKEKDIFIHFSSKGYLPILEVDPVRIRQVISNLINNAIKFSDSESLIEIFVEEAKSKLIIRIKDSGIGIDPDNLDRIFLPFEQIQNEKSVKNDGVGLGLSISKKIIEFHDGTIHAESTLGKGSTFTVILPVDN